VKPTTTIAAVVVVIIVIISIITSSRGCRPPLACLLSVDATIIITNTTNTVWCNKETKGKRSPASKQQQKEPKSKSQEFATGGGQSI